MRFIVSSIHLLKKLQILGGVLGNSTMPILEYFLFELDKDSIKLSVTDLETSMNATLTVESESKGRFALQGKMLLEILKQIPEQPLTFVLKDDHTVEISSTQGNYSIAYNTGEDFPEPISLPDSKMVNLRGEVLAKAINKTLFATGNDDMRPMMNGVFFKFSPEKLVFVATDAHKLATYERTDTTCEISGEFIMPKKPLTLLRNTYADVKEEIGISFNDQNARFEYGGIMLICRLVDSKFPDYNVVIPKENPNVLTITREELLSSVRRMTLFSNKLNHQVKLSIAGASLKISANDPDYNSQAEERLNCQYVGDDMEIGFNSRFFSEMLGLLDADEITLEMSLPNRAAILRPLDGNESGESIMMLVMPVIVAND